MKSLKRILSYVMVIVMGVFLFSGVNFKNASAYESEFKTDKGTLFYQINDNNEVTITNYLGEDTELVIPSKIDGKSVTSTEWNVFGRCSSLKSITIPNSVTSIGREAFSGCSSLTNINVDKENKCFSSENGILFNKDKSELLYYPEGKKEKKYIIPNIVTSIGMYAFKNCSNLTNVTIPNSVISIEGCAFMGCSSLISITIPNSVTSIGWSAFNGCSSLKSITIPNSVISIKDHAFYGCSSLTSITIPNSVTIIRDGTFENCSSLTSIIIPDSVTSICDYKFDGSTNGAFEGCSSLTSITIPSSVTNIALGAFKDCDNLENINIDKNNKCFSSENGVLFNKDKSELLYYPHGKKEKEYIIPNTVTNIGNYAFRDCSTLKSITIPNTVTSIEGRAFSGCSSLTNITIPSSVTNIGNYAFEGCSSLTSITIPNTVTSIGRNEFNGCSSLTSITIPESVTSIEDYAFEGCSSLTSITIPNSVTSIGMYAFSGCSSLTSITIPESVTSIGWYAFGYYNNLTIYGYKNSYAETYANENSIPFKELASQNLNIESFTTDKASPQVSGTKVKLTAKATGNGNLQYKYYRYLNGKYALIKDWSNNNSITMAPSTVGKYDIYVAVKDEIGNTVRKNIVFEFKEQENLAISSFTASKTSPQPVKTIVTLTAKATGVTGTAQYKYYRYLNGKCATIKDWSTSSSIKIAPNTAGKYDIYVAVKDGSGNIVRKNVVFEFKEQANLGISSFTADKTSPQAVNTIVTLTAKATGITGTAQYKYYRYLNGKCATIKDWSTSSSIKIAPSTAGKYDIYVAVKDGSGNIVRKNMVFEFKEQANLAISSFTASKTSPQPLKTAVILTTKVSGATGIVEYKYYRYLNGNYALIKDWSTNNSITIAPSKTGTYDLWVAVKDSTGKIVRKSMEYTIKQ